ncbi:MAG: RpiR family transcriptional regulator [Mycobacterium sp.]|jgi:putative oxidoreductase|nr:RpiR family transcriptional regulator [Mycobacterium sp.]
MSDHTARDLGLLALRAGVGGTLFAHGAQKLFGWFGGSGLSGTGAMFDQIGFKPGKTNALAAGLGEAGGGALLALGLATPAAGAAVAGTMAVAASMHAPQGFFSNKGGLEFPAVLGVAAAALALTGPGELSVDRLLGHRANRSWMRIALALAPPAATLVIIRRRNAVAAAAATETPAEPDPTASAG